MIRRLFNNLFLNNKFSDFAHLGDLSLLHLTEVRSHLQSYWKEEIEVYESFQMITWSNKYCLYVIYYNLNGEFLHLKEERWFKENLTFLHKLNPKSVHLKEVV
jgi:hypothetical protein